MKNRNTCPHCGRELLMEDTQCPYCGASLKSKGGKKIGKLLLILLIVAGLVGGICWLALEDPLSLFTPKSRVNDADAPTDALSLLEYGPHSQSGLAESLEYMGYSPEVAAEAAAGCGADWNEQALLRAIRCLDDTYGGYSPSGLEEQLTWGGFTEEQIRYAMENLPPVDWQLQADRSAAGYLDAIPMSKADLTGQLEYEGFAPELVEAAVENCGADSAENALTVLREESAFTGRDELRELLEYKGFTEAEIEYALENR